MSGKKRLLSKPLGLWVPHYNRDLSWVYLWSRPLPVEGLAALPLCDWWPQIYGMLLLCDKGLVPGQAKLLLSPQSLQDCNPLAWPYQAFAHGPPLHIYISEDRVDWMHFPYLSVFPPSSDYWLTPVSHINHSLYSQTCFSCHLNFRPVLLVLPQQARQG